VQPPGGVEFIEENVADQTCALESHQAKAVRLSQLSGGYVIESSQRVQNLLLLFFAIFANELNLSLPHRPSAA